MRIELGNIAVAPAVGGKLMLIVALLVMKD